MLRFFILAVCSLVCLSVSGRTPPSAGWKPITPKDLAITAAEIGDPDADAAILFREGDLNDSYPDGTGLRIYLRIKVFTDRGRRWADVQLPYRMELGRITDVHARTVRPDGSPVEVEGRDIFDRVLMKTSHGIWRAKVFSMPVVEAGSIIEYRYRQVYPNGFRYFALDLQSELYTRELYYRIQPPAASKLDMRWVSFNARDPKQFTPQWDGGFYIKATDIPPFRREPMMPPDKAVKVWGWLYYSDDFLVEPEKYWRDYSARAFTRSETETRPSRAIKRVVEAITLSSENAQSKIARIYEYVQSEIKNLGYREQTDGEAGVDTEFKRNNSAEETLRRRYGTSGEINRLFVAMLRACGLDARVAELTSRDEAIFRRTFADSFQFDTELTALVGRDESIQFYDPGTVSCPPGALAWEKEAVPALIHGRKGDPFVETTLSDASQNAVQRAIKLTIAADGKVRAQSSLRLLGQQSTELRSAFSGLPRDERLKLVAARARASSPLIALDESTINIAEERKNYGPVAIKYDFDAPQAVTRTEKRLLIRPASLTTRDESLAELPSRMNSIYFHYPWSESDRLEITTPDGFSVEELPQPVDLDIGAARYHSAFARVGDHVIFERTISVNAIYLTPEQYPAAKAFFDRAHEADRAAISFREK